MGFFDKRQGAAVLKHGILRRYLPGFVRKVGSRSGAGRVAYVDTHAGDGAYTDGNPGSPALAAQTANSLTACRQLECHYVEKRRGACERLRRVLAPMDHTHDVIHGSVDDKLPGIVDRTKGLPMLAFVDPYGIPPPIDLLKSMLTRPGSVGAWRDGPPTELIINFSMPGMYRNGGKMRSTSENEKFLKGKPKLVRHMDEALGGAWWQPLCMQNDAGWELEVLDGYRQRLSASGRGWSSFRVPVADRQGSNPDYYLILLTQHRDGLWLFNNCLSLANEEYYTFCHRGELDLDPVDARALRWIEHISRNLERLLSSGKPFVLWEQMQHVYGDVLGLARETHVRTALEHLYAAGVTLTNPKGTKQLQNLRVLPCARRPAA